MSVGKEGVQQAEVKEEQEDREKQEVLTFRAKSNSLARSARPHSMKNLDSRHRQHRVNVDRELSGESSPCTTTDSQLGSTRALRNSDCSTDRSRSSGLGNVTHSSALPASVRRRAQSVSEATPRSRNTRKAVSNLGKKMDHPKSLGKGPRVPLATSKTDSPVHKSSGTHSPHLVSGELTAKSPATPRNGGQPARNPSPIQLESTLVEEDEDGGDTGGRKGQESPVKRQADQTVTSRVPIETESAAFQVDARELQVTLEAIPRLSVGESIVAAPLQSDSTSLPTSPSGSPSRKSKLPLTGPESTPPTSTQTSATLTHSPNRLPEPHTGGRAKSTSPIVGLNHGENESPLCNSRSMSTMALAGGTGGERESGQRSSMTLPRKSKHTVIFKEKSTKGKERM